MKKKLLLFVLFAIIILTNCSLERNNPLDPDNTGVPAPGIITDIKLTAYSGVINICWNHLQGNVDYYTVYRALYYNGEYEGIIDILRPEQPEEETEEHDDTSVISGNQYWYKLSATSKSGLEGPLSPAVGKPAQ